MSSSLETKESVRHTVTVGRSEFSMRSRNSLGTDALNAIAAIPGAFDLQVESESDRRAVISYVWKATEKFWQTEEHLNVRGLRRLDWL